jgi:hypothetical protein
MDQTTKILFSAILNIGCLLPSAVSAALVEYTGSGTFTNDGITHHNATFSMVIDDDFHRYGRTIQWYRDNQPTDAIQNRIYGRFDIVESTLTIDGNDPITRISKSNDISVYYDNFVRDENGGIVTDENGDFITNRSWVTPYIEGIYTAWGFGVGWFSDESGNRLQYDDFDSWWGDNPTEELPSVLAMTRFSTFQYFDETILLHPVPIPATVWLLGSGLLGLLTVGRRKHRS